jgi:AcrR family transcriptional regulator
MQPSYSSDYTGTVSEPHASSLRADHVLQTRAALLRAARDQFGRKGFSLTSVGDIAREARVTSGALYHHFPTKTALFEAVFEQIHEDLMAASNQAAAAVTGVADVLAAVQVRSEGAEGGAPAAGMEIGVEVWVEVLARGFEAFLDAVLDPVVQRIVIVDAPAVLGLARFTELDERDALTAIVAVLDAAAASGAIQADDPETLARLFMGALTRGAMLIANSEDPQRTRDTVAAATRQLLACLMRP